jgi:hypothetical protein
MRSHVKTMLSMIAFFLISLCLNISPADAKDGIRVGKFKVDSGVTLKGEYNDNIFWSAGNEKDDYIWTVTPKASIGYFDSLDNYMSLGYLVDLVKYSDYDDNNFQRHNPYFRFGYQAPAGLYIKIDESYINTEDPYGSENEYGLGLSTKRWNNTLAFTGGFNFAEKYGIEASYRNYIECYDETTDRWQDHVDKIYGIALFYKLSAKTKIFGQYRLKLVDYNEQEHGAKPKTGPAWSSTTSQNNKQNNFFAGARFTPFSKISGEAKIGYGNIRYDNKTDRNGIAYSDKDTWVAETNIGYDIRTRTRIGFVLMRSYRVSSDEGADAPGYFDTLAGIELTQKMINKIAANIGFDWETLDYQKSGTEKYFDIYKIRAGLSYPLNEWLDIGVKYEYSKKTATESKYESSEYKINSVSAFINAKL